MSIRALPLNSNTRAIRSHGSIAGHLPDVVSQVLVLRCVWSHTHASLLVPAGIPTRVVSERLGHANPGFTNYQHVLPGMGADAAHRFSQLLSDSR